MNEYHGHSLTLMTTWTEIFLILLTAVTASVTGITKRDYLQQVFNFQTKSINLPGHFFVLSARIEIGPS